MNRGRIEGQLRARSAILAVTVLALTAGWADGQDRGSLQQKLSSQFSPAEVATDRSAVLTAGTIVVLQKDNFLMHAGSCGASPLNTYTKEKLGQPFRENFVRYAKVSGGVAGCPSRRFVRGTKLWVTKADVVKDGVVFTLYCTPDNDSIYYADLKIPFEKDTIPTPDQAMAMIKDVVKIQPPDAAAQTSNNGPAQPPPPAYPAREAPPAPIAPPPPPAEVVPPTPPTPAMAEIPPPPPPPADPVTVELGQTVQQVETALGRPETILKPAVGTIRYVYAAKGIKVTFKNGKVADIQ